MLRPPNNVSQALRGEGRIWLHTRLEEGGRYVAIPRQALYRRSRSTRESNLANSVRPGPILDNTEHEGGGRWWGGAGRRGGDGAGQVGEDRADDGGILHGGEDAQPAATAGTGQDIEIEHAAHQRRPGPGLRGDGGAGAGVELARGGLRAREAVADNL
jgi:hypothetical protein